MAAQGNTKPSRRCSRSVSNLEESLTAEHAMVRRVFQEAQGAQGHSRAAAREAAPHG